MTELFLTLPFAIAMLVALLLPVLGLLQYRWVAQVSPDARVIILLLLMALGAILSIGFTNRSLDESHLLANSAREVHEDGAGGFAASRLFSAFLVGAGFIEIVRGWLNSRASKVADPAQPILLALLGLYLGTLLIQGIASDVPSFSYKNLYPLTAFLALYYQPVKNLPRVVGAVKLAIIVLSVSSLLFMAVKPDFVLQRPAASVLPGIDFRLFGLTAHANTIGPVALLGIVLELAYPSRFLALRWTQLVASSVVFVLAQSKTAWVAGMLLIPLIVLPLSMAPSRNPGKRRNDFARTVTMLLVAIAFVMALLLLVARYDVIDLVQSKVAGVDTLTGRTRIWRITLDAWRDNVLFGYGAEIWGIDRRIKFNMLYVGMAHNQFIQTLGDSGLVGLLLLLTYLGVLMRAAVKWFVPSRGVMLAILTLVLARCMTEAPMRAVDLLSWPLFTHLVLLMMACYYVRRGKSEQLLKAQSRSAFDRENDLSRAASPSPRGNP
jgi:O-Antigen ligase